MAISPPTDIVMDVLRAADPQAAEAARAKLQTVAGSASPAGSFPAGSFSAAGDPSPSVAAQAARRGAADPFQKFEAMVLGSFIQSMLPQEAGEAYGGGYAGDMWKSLLAQQLGDSVAAAGGIGISNRLLADHYRDGEFTRPLAGAVDPAARAAGNEQALLSTALVQELQRQVTQSMLGVEAADHGATAR